MLEGLDLPINSKDLLNPPVLHFAQRIDVVVWNPRDPIEA